MHNQSTITAIHTLIACALIICVLTLPVANAEQGMRASSWGKGANAGSYDPSTFTWKPGRDVNGVINRASFDLLPLKTWVKVEGTTMKDNLEPRIKAAIPTWRELGNWGMYTRAWNGFAVDREGNRAWFFGGGHADGSNNGLYRLDAAKLQWDIEALPSDPAKWDPNYAKRPPVTGSYTIYTETKAQWERDRSEYHDVDNQGNPTARHTYRSMVYDSINDRVIMWCRRYWEFDLKTKRWSKRFPYERIFKPGEDYRAVQGFNATDISVVFDEPTQTVYMGVTANGSAGRWIARNVVTGQWHDPKFMWGGYFILGGAAEQRGRKIYSIHYVGRFNAHAPDFWPLKLRWADLDQKTKGNTELVFLDGITIDHFENAGQGGLSLTYVDDWDGFIYGVSKFLDVDGTRRSFVLLWIDPGKSTLGYLSTQKGIQRGALPENPFYIVERNIVYFPRLHMLLWMDSGESPLYVMRTK